MSVRQQTVQFTEEEDLKAQWQHRALPPHPPQRPTTGGLMAPGQVLRLAVNVAFYAVFLCAAAAVFVALERPLEEELVREVKAARDKFLTENTCVSG